MTKSKFRIGDKVFYHYYKDKPFKGCGVVDNITTVYEKDNKYDIIVVKFYYNDNLIYAEREFTLDGKLSKNLNQVLFHNEKEFEKKYLSYSPTETRCTINSDKFDIFKELIRIRDLYNDDWKPKFRTLDSNTVLTCIDEKIRITYTWSERRSFIFKYEELALEFLDTYKEYLNLIKDLI